MDKIYASKHSGGKEEEGSTCGALAPSGYKHTIEESITNGPSSREYPPTPFELRVVVSATAKYNCYDNR